MIVVDVKMVDFYVYFEIKISQVVEVIQFEFLLYEVVVFKM